MADARDIIYEDISTKIPGEKMLAGSSFQIVCPFHADKNPSCGVNLSDEGTIPLGYWHCFGCGAKGPWNKLAEKLGLTVLKDWQFSYKGSVGGEFDRARRERNAGIEHVTEEQRLNAAIKTKEMIPWPKTKKWRGYSGKLIAKMGGMLFNDPVMQDMMLFLPVHINGMLKGGVRAFMKKNTRGGPSYLTTKGVWVKTSGLLGYDLTKKYVRKYGYRAVVLVEGPRDYMRLLLNSIPALAVLGSENVSTKKILKVLAISSNIKTIYVLPDNDKGGRVMYENVKRAAEGLVEVKLLKLPREKDKDGKVIKMDPHSATQEIIDEVKELLDSTIRKRK